MDIKEKIKYWAKRLYDRGYSPATSGNISLKTQNEIIISSSGSCLGELEDSDLILTDLEGVAIKNGRKPSSEKNLHVEIYKQNPRISAIIHCHSPYLSAYALLAKDINKSYMAEFTFYFDKIPCAPYALPSSDELVKNTAPYFKKHELVLMANHGCVVGATNLKEAFLKIESAEYYAKTTILAKIIGQPVELNEEQINDILNLKRG